MISASLHRQPDSRRRVLSCWPRRAELLISIARVTLETHRLNRCGGRRLLLMPLLLSLLPRQTSSLALRLPVTADENLSIPASSPPDSSDAPPPVPVDKLHELEMERMAGMKPARKLSFAGGRVALRRALTALCVDGAVGCPVLPDGVGAPTLPDGTLSARLATPTAWRRPLFASSPMRSSPPPAASPRWPRCKRGYHRSGAAPLALTSSPSTAYSRRASRAAAFTSLSA